MNSELLTMGAALDVLIETTVASSLALLAVLMLRVPFRRVWGARSAYALWLLVPLALMAVLLPAPPAPSTAVAASPVLIPAENMAQATTAVASTFDPTTTVVAAWAAGLILAATGLLRRQRRFDRDLGRLSPRGDGTWEAQHTLHGPAVVGALRSRIVLPSDFDARYSAEERELVLRHERLHLLRGDLVANLFAATLRCVFWFNPLVHYAAGRLRFDQELAVDAAVLAQRPEARRTYAEAMLKTQGVALLPPLGCHWQSAHPLKVRVAMLKHAAPGALRLMFGFVLSIGAAIGGGAVAWANQPAATASVAGGSDGDGESFPVRMRVYEHDKLLTSEEFTVPAGGTQVNVDARYGHLEFDIASMDNGMVEVLATVTRDGVIVERPHMQSQRGRSASFAMDDDQKAPSDLLVEFDIDPLAPAAAIYNTTRRPKYPEGAGKGDVILRVQVDEQGKPASIAVETSSGDAAIDAAARDSVSTWIFEAARRDGKAVVSEVLVPISFGDEVSDAQNSASATAVLDPIYVKRD